MAHPQAHAAAADGPPLPAERKPSGGKAWDTVFIIDLVMVGLFGLVALLSIFAPSGTGTVDPDATRALLWVQNGFALLVMGIVPFGWVWGTRAGGLSGALDYLGLRRPLLGIGIGLLALLAIYLVVGLLSAVLQQIAPELLENPQVEQLGPSLTWPLVIATALVAGIAEEILFRGILQKYIGLWGQAAAFGVLHIGYATVLQVVVPFLIGLAFGYMVRRGWPLWAPITAHVAFDLVALSATKYCADAEASSALCGA